MGAASLVPMIAQTASSRLSLAKVAVEAHGDSDLARAGPAVLVDEDSRLAVEQGDLPPRSTTASSSLPLPSVVGSALVATIRAVAS